MSASTTKEEPQPPVTSTSMITSVPEDDKPTLVSGSSKRTTPPAQNLTASKSEPAVMPRSSPSSKSRKVGFLGLLFCCTMGADGLYDSGHKSDTLRLGQIKRQQQPAIVGERTAISATPVVQAGGSTSTSEPQTSDNEMGGPARTGTASPVTVPGTPEIEPVRLLGPVGPEDEGRKCLVLDLDETLVHSSFKIIHQADYIVPVEIENQTHNVYVIKRPGVDEFLRRMGELYEIVVFTASLSKYADPVLDMLDIHRVVRHRLFRESCHNHRGNYVKDLSQVGRDLTQTIIIDNSPASYIFHVNNAVPISSWFNDPHDTELLDLIPFLDDLTGVPDVTMVLDTTNLPPDATEGA